MSAERERDKPEPKIRIASWIPEFLIGFGWNEECWHL